MYTLSSWVQPFTFLDEILERFVKKMYVYLKENDNFWFFMHDVVEVFKENNHLLPNGYR